MWAGGVILFADLHAALPIVAGQQATLHFLLLGNQHALAHRIAQKQPTHTPALQKQWDHASTIAQRALPA